MNSVYDCTLAMEITEPGTPLCPPVAARVPPEVLASGSGLGCALGPAPGTSLLVFVALVGIGSVAYARARREGR
jgi:hypothetical protein